MSNTEPEHVPQRRCPKCDTWYDIKSVSAEQDSPTPCPNCDWSMPSASEDYPDS